MLEIEKLIHAIGLNLQPNSKEFYELLNLFESFKKGILDESN